ncbi:hypothetical protein RQN30_09440 [Arcanobacterium hippocoleae]
MDLSAKICVWVTAAFSALFFGSAMMSDLDSVAAANFNTANMYLPHTGGITLNNVNKLVCSFLLALPGCENK